MEQLKVDANIGVVQKTTLIGTAHILRRVLERQEKEVTYWPLVISFMACCPIALMVFCNNILRNMYAFSLTITMIMTLNFEKSNSHLFLFPKRHLKGFVENFPSFYLVCSCVIIIDSK